MEGPRLLPKLRAALACLYGDAARSQQDPRHQREAHEFLLAFRSSNVRRAVVSRVQSRKDRVGSGDGDGDRRPIPPDQPGDGSVFLCSLALLLQSLGALSGADGGGRVHESIFAAQTLNHRCRSIKLVEALDLEAEDGVEGGVARLVMAWEEIKAERARLSNAPDESNAADWNALLSGKSTTILKAWLERYIPMLISRCGADGSGLREGRLCDGAQLLALVLQRHSSSLLADASYPEEEKREDNIKGTVILLALAVALYAAAFREHLEKQQQPSCAQPWANSVLSDLGSALSITALRVRYRPMKDKHATPLPHPSCPPLIDMLVNAVNAVKVSAEIYFSQSSQSQEGGTIHRAHLHAVRRSISACMRALPDTVLLPPGHDNTGHRIPSVDRACLRAASAELRYVNDVDNNVGTGIDRAWSVLVESERGGIGEGQLDGHDTSASRLLDCCEAWARFVAVPVSIVEASVGSLAVGYLHVSRGPVSQQARASAFQYLTSLLEAASPSLTSDDVLTAALGVGAGGHRGKGSGAGGTSKKGKKQGSRSKKRQEKRLGRAIAVKDDRDAEVAEEELLARRNAACVAAAHAFGISLADASVMGSDWGLRLAATSPSASSHDVCSTAAAAAASVLSHLLHLERERVMHSSHNDSGHWRLELFSAVTMAIRHMCASSNRSIRALAYEPLMILHSSLNLVSSVSIEVERVAVDATCQCVLALASSCGYPHGYFDRLSENSDEELEVERNDIRDVARSVCSLDSGNTGSHGQKSPSILVLEHIVRACHDAMQGCAHLPPETAVHLLSALAKPLNKLGRLYQQSKIGCECEIMIMSVCMNALWGVCDQLNTALFDSHPMSRTEKCQFRQERPALQELNLPLSRLALMGASSLSPMFSSLSEVVLNRQATTDAEHEMFMNLRKALLFSLRHSILSTAQIPELVAESTLQSTRYDIKGAMRGPGGEDHVGCIALLRLSHESDCLASAIFGVYGHTILHDLSNLHHELKTSELRRGPSCDWGVGVTPVSRRIILRVISRMALHGMNETKDQHDEGRAIITKLLQAPLEEMKSQKEAPVSAGKIYRLCEDAYDISFFSSELVADLFYHRAHDLQILFDCTISGYSALLSLPDADICHQWGRLRGGAYCVLCAGLKHTISDNAAAIIAAIIKAECESAEFQCNQGPESGSNIFNDNIVGEHKVHAGLFITLIRDCLDRIAKGKGPIEQYIDEVQRCILVLKDTSSAVTSLLLHQSPEAQSHVDPRPTIAESWFLALVSLAGIFRSNNEVAAHVDVVALFGESLSMATTLIFLKDLGSKRAPAPVIQKGLSLDGPHTLAMVSYISESLLLGPSISVVAGKKILSALQINDTLKGDVSGQIIITSSLLRAVSGALPPWAVEETPELFRSMHLALGGDYNNFVQILSASAEVKCSAPFGGIRAGELLAGRYLDVSSRHIESFLLQAQEVCMKGDWKKLKVILKSTCGGKKKDSSFNLKPQLTSWDCERL
ncbi:hypothetical protein ACHAWF_009281 [Thalassiosira exigua]